MRRGIRGLALLMAAISPAAAQSARGKNALVQLSASIRELTNRVSPAIVEIHVSGYGVTDDQKGRGVSEVSRQRSTGSGVVVDAAGYIVTNAHVIEGAVNIQVIAAPGTRPSTARILGIDRDSDLALLRIDAEHLPALRFGDSDELHQGDLVLAIGSPMGLHNSVSMGVVSAPARAVSDDDPILYIQTDAPINPGNSGGALVDTAGALIGLNTFIVSQSGGNEGIGFAIPSNVVRSVYEQLRHTGKVSRGSLGMIVQNITRPMAKGLGLPLEHGVVVADIQPGGPAEMSGVKRRDIVISVNGKPIETARQFEDSIYRRKAGDQMTLVVQREDGRLSVNAEVKEHTAPWDPLASMVSPEKNLVPRLGILCIEVDQKIVELLPDLRRQYGLIVAAKSPEGQAQFLDLQPGDIIHALNNVPVASLAMFQTEIEKIERGGAVVLQIERDGHFQYVAFDIE